MYFCCWNLVNLQENFDKSCQSWHFSWSNLAKTQILPFWNLQNPSFYIWCLWNVTFSRKFVSSLIWERNSAITLQIFTNFMSNWQKNPNFRVSEIAKNVIFCQIWHFSLSNLAKTHIFPFSNFQNPSFDIWCLWNVTFWRKSVSRFYFCEILEWFDRISLWNYQKELIWRKNWHKICENLQLQFTKGLTFDFW